MGKRIPIARMQIFSTSHSRMSRAARTSWSSPRRHRKGCWHSRFADAWAITVQARRAECVSPSPWTLISLYCWAHAWRCCSLRYCSPPAAQQQTIKPLSSQRSYRHYNLAPYSTLTGSPLGCRISSKRSKATKTRRTSPSDELIREPLGSSSWSLSDRDLPFHASRSDSLGNRSTSSKLDFCRTRTESTKNKIVRKITVCQLIST